MKKFETQAVLDRAYEFVQEVEYKISLRYIFYKLLQEGYYEDKIKGYGNLKDLLRRARKELKDNWTPDTLCDESRKRIYRTGGKRDIQECKDSILDEIVNSISECFVLDHFYQQEVYLEIWFEARGMVNQFRHYTRNIDLVPMSGDASIPYKWDIAKNLEDCKSRYVKDIIILYFGDSDFKGHEIMRAVQVDVEYWSDVPFTIEWCGITKKQAKKYKVPENPYKPKQFQWAALPDKVAGKIIQSSIAKYLDVDLIDQIRSDAEPFILEWEDNIRDALDSL